MDIVRLQSDEGEQIEYIDEIVAQGGMKDVYFSPDKTYAVAFYREPLDSNSCERLKAIYGPYRQGIFENKGGEFWSDLFCWPQSIVRKGNLIGIVVPFFRPNYFFSYGSIKDDILKIRGKEKEGKWFASASNRSKFLDPREKGNWLSHLQICLSISRAVRRLHAAGLAHSDLSYKNVLVDPTQGKACLIDLDGLVVPGKFPPDVVGTPDFIAPEVIATQHLDKKDPNRKLPSILTDRHALAVLIYMYLFYRHPLRGRKVHDLDAIKDEELSMGTGALFVENASDSSNRVNSEDFSEHHLPWCDPSLMPFDVSGPILKDLFLRSFVSGIHNPEQRPTAAEWENGILRTIDLIQPCTNNCEMGWYVFDNTTKPKCPFCGQFYNRPLPVLNLYSSRHSGAYQPDNHRIMVWDGQSLFRWHTNRGIYPNEHLKPDQQKRVGYFQFYDGSWILVNEDMPDLFDLQNSKAIPIGGYVQLAEGNQFLLSKEEKGRLIQVQIANT